MQNGAGDADIKKPEKVSTVIPQYLQGTDPRSPRDSKIQGGSSPLYKTVQYSGPSAIKESASVQVQELQMRTADYISSQRTAKRGLRPVGVRNPGPLPSWSNPKASSGHGAAHSGAEPHTWPL